MKSPILLLALAVAFPQIAAGEELELRLYETREGKLDALNARFRDHTIGLFTKHGIESVAYFTPAEEPESENMLIYFVRHPNPGEAAQNWKAFASDPDWKEAAKNSGVGKLAKRPESIYLKWVPYWSSFDFGEVDEDDVYELRMYTAAKGKLGKLDARFRDHTIKLFAKHGIHSVGYWHATEEPDSENKLIYLIKHHSREAAKKSWKAFAADPDWKAARDASGVGKLAEPIRSYYLKLTDYSPEPKINESE
ncbi:MAG: NIPSNAP family protein [Planctomycetota bacterium]